jgi:phosphohistidine phosphatase
LGKDDAFQVYLLRHAIAVERGSAVYPNDDRPLTDEGIKKMKTVAKGISCIVDSFEVILTSPLKRAFQTAQITASAVGCAKNIRVVDDLLPGATPEKIFRLIAEYKSRGRVLLVGHEPDLGFFASYLLGAKESVVEFKKGALCRIDVSFVKGRGQGVLVGLFQPKHLCLLGEK